MSSSSWKGSRLSSHQRPTLGENDPKAQLAAQHALNKYPEPMISKATDKIVLQKFNKEFTAVLQQLLDSDKLLPSMIDSYIFTQLMNELGCTRQLDMENDQSQEFKKVEEIWLSLLKCAQHPQQKKATRKQAISVGDTKLFLMAIFGIRGNKRIGQDDEKLAEFQNQQTPENQLPYGYLNEQNQLCLTEKCVARIRSKFSLMHSNRINHYGKVLDAKKEFEQKAKRFDFQPKFQAMKMNNKILADQKKWDKVAKRKDFPVAKVTALRARSVSKDYKIFYESQAVWRQSEQRKAVKKEVAECTFKPNIQKSSKNVRPAATTYLTIS